MSHTFVLVHGAWHGGWSWQLVRRRLESAGHRVITPTLTGLGDRRHLASPRTGLSVHVEDVVAAMEFEDLHDVVLLGHSYAGQVISGVASARPGRIRALVFHDAFVPEDGQSALDLLPPTIASHFVESAKTAGDGWLMPQRPLAALGVTDEKARAWLEPRLVPHPLRTYQDGARVGDDVAAIPSGFLECTGWAGIFAPHAAKARARGWPVRRIAADHEALATAPGELAETLTDLTAQLVT
jgi:pimeloyl-ACP methyl ester carboxylesterase